MMVLFLSKIYEPNMKHIMQQDINLVIINAFCRMLGTRKQKRAKFACFKTIHKTSDTIKGEITESFISKLAKKKFTYCSIFT